VTGGTGGTGVRVTTPSSREIVLARDFAAPRPLVYAAWTRPELLRRWFGARGWHLVHCEVDLRVGGAWRFVSQGPGGAQLAHGGVYQVVTAPERLVYTELYEDQSYPGETLIGHEFAEHNGTTTVTSTVRYATPEGRDRVLQYPMRRGVAEGYDRLAALLASLPREEGQV
jgi:uncharacterized protein YndB with AHSA1/START domain